MSSATVWCVVSVSAGVTLTHDERDVAQVFVRRLGLTIAMTAADTHMTMNRAYVWTHWLFN